MGGGGSEKLMDGGWGGTEVGGVKMKFSVLGLVGMGLVFGAAAEAGDWPHQRGPGLDGKVASGERVPEVLPDDPEVIWKLAVTDGFAAPIVSGGMVVFGDFQKGKEVYHGVRLADGEVVWSDVLDGPHKDGFGTGPRCAPVSDGEIVLVQSCKGELHCLDLGSGKLLWRKNYLEDFGSLYVGEKGTTEGAARHGYSASPCIDGDHVITLAGGPGAGVVCFEKTSGEVVWKSEDDQAAYSPPVVVTLAGVEQVVCFTVSGVIGLERDSGKLLWRVPMKTAYGRHVVAPAVWGDLVVVGSHELGLVATRVVNEGGKLRAEEAWRLGKDQAPNFASSVVIGDFLYALLGNRVVCLECATGEVRWEEDGLVNTAAARAFCAFVGMGERVMMLNDMGELILFRADPGGYDELSRVQVCGKNWCHPAYVDGRLVVRDGKRLVCVRLTGGE